MPRRTTRPCLMTFGCHFHSTPQHVSCFGFQSYLQLRYSTTRQNLKQQAQACKPRLLLLFVCQATAFKSCGGTVLPSACSTTGLSLCIYIQNFSTQQAAKICQNDRTCSRTLLHLLFLLGLERCRSLARKQEETACSTCFQQTCLEGVKLRSR